MKNTIFDGNAVGVSQLINSKHKYPIELWKKGFNNNWSPLAVPMNEDIVQWKTAGLITDDEKLLVKRTLGLFAAGESLVANSIMFGEFQQIKDGACRQYMARKLFEETLHNFTVQVCCESYSLSVEEVAEAYRNIPTIKAKDAFLEKSISRISEQDTNIDSVEKAREVARNMFIFYIICEGTWFYPNFAMIASLGKQAKLKGLAKQIEYTIRDESLHLEFGVYILNTIRTEIPKVFTKEFENELISLMKEAVEIERNYVNDILPRGIMGVNAEMMYEYVRFIANVRLKMVGLSPIYENVQNKFTWLEEALGAEKMVAFFEGKNHNYQNAAALVDDYN